jgi:hypothetical protein
MTELNLIFFGLTVGFFLQSLARLAPTKTNNLGKGFIEISELHGLAPVLADQLRSLLVGQHLWYEGLSLWRSNLSRRF